MQLLPNAAVGTAGTHVDFQTRNLSNTRQERPKIL